MRKEAINVKERMMSYMGTFEEWKGKRYIYIYIYPWVCLTWNAWKSQGIKSHWAQDASRSGIEENK